MATRLGRVTSSPRYSPQDRPERRAHRGDHGGEILGHLPLWPALSKAGPLVEAPPAPPERSFEEPIRERRRVPARAERRAHRLADLSGVERRAFQQQVEV